MRAPDALGRCDRRRAPDQSACECAQGFAWLPEDDFLNHFAGDIDPVKAKVMYAVQQPLHASTLEDVMGVPAWRALPTWFLVAEGDEAIPRDAERQFAMVSHPDETLNLIDAAAQAPSQPGSNPRDRWRTDHV
jgi:hypothetical protein